MPSRQRSDAADALVDFRVGSESTTIRALVARIAELERNHADARAEARQLLDVADATRAIASSRDIDEIVGFLLQAMREPLGFDRAMYFSVDRDAGIKARVQIDGSDTIEPCDAELDPTGIAVDVLRGQPEGYGHAHDLSAPLVDVRGWYVLSPLAANEKTSGLLYADGLQTRVPIDWQARQAHSLASVAAIAIENARHIATTQTLASRDSLTGLYNRRVLEEHVRSAMAESTQSKRPFAFVMIDVDDFKAINDRYGHAHGDDVLISLATTLTAHSRTGDIVGRYAGDEFVVIMANLDAPLAHTLVARLSGDLRAHDLRCSLGAALYPDDAHDARSLMEAADRALYRTKAAGKNGYSFCS